MAIGGRIPSDAENADRSEPVGNGNFSFLDQALWKQFREAVTAEEFARAWLALQCRFIKGATAGVVVLGEPDQGPFSPAAFWPDENAASAELSAAAEMAMNERRGVVRDADDGRHASGVAFPLMIDGHLFGVVAVEVAGESSARLREVMRLLQWGAAWMELLFRREQAKTDEEQRERTAAAFDLVAAALEQERFKAACNAVVTELAMRLGCDQVSIGFVRRRRTVLAAVSHAAQFGKRMNLIRDIGGAMDEAVDQEAVVVYPAKSEWDYRITRAHADLAQTHQAGSILSVPLHSGDRMLGALTFERPAGEDFDEPTIELCDCVASVLGPILEEKRRNDRHILVKLAESIWVQLKRLLGPHYFGRKLATVIAIAVVAFFMVAKGEYRITSPAVLEGEIQRTLVAPFEGYLATQHARAGEIVRKGDVLATLDDQDLALERLRSSTQRRQHLAEYDRALANRERAQANIVRAQIEQAEAQVALLDEQLARTRISAPFDGIVVEGDLTQQVGAAVERGQELFKIAPLHAYRVILEVDESDIDTIHEGQTGTLAVTSTPDTPLDFTIQRVTPISEQQEGRNFFRVEAALHQVNDRLRPGMKGVAKTHVEERLLIFIWTEKLADWVRLQLWKWLP